MPGADVTEPADRWVRAADWTRIAALVGLQSGAVPADVIAALERRRATKDATLAEREARTAAIRGCRRCDPSGWLLGRDGAPVDPATRCDHDAAGPRVVRDVTAPLHEPPDVS